MPSGKDLFDDLVASMVSRYGDQGYFVAVRLAKMVKYAAEIGCMTWMVAEVGTKEEAGFDDWIEHCCCGIETKTITHYPTGRVFKLGVNFGH